MGRSAEVTERAQLSSSTRHAARGTSTVDEDEDDLAPGTYRDLLGRCEAMLDHERLDLYRASVELVREALHVGDRSPRGFGPVADQLRRVAVSVPLNSAVAMGRSGREDRRRNLTIARGSAMECGALFDVVDLLHGDESVVERKTLLEIVAMLTSSAQRSTGRERPRSSSVSRTVLVLVPVLPASCRVLDLVRNPFRHPHSCQESQKILLAFCLP